jgi:hypothetical protein
MAGRAAALSQSLLPRGNGEPASTRPCVDRDGLRKYLLSQYKEGHLSAKAVCDIAWHADRAGACDVRDLAANPSSAHAAEHLRNALNVTSENDFYFADVPMWNHTTQVRELRKFPMSLPHERFCEECRDFDVCSYQRNLFPPRYWSHPVTLTTGQAKTVPIGYFSDGVPHTKKDSFLAFYWSNLLTGRAGRGHSNIYRLGLFAEVPGEALGTIPRGSRTVRYWP